MCHRVVCHSCGKFTWEGCGLHIDQALAGLSLKQICSCNDDRDSEHTWTALTSASSSHSKTSSTSITEAALRKERQAAALDGLKIRKHENEQELKEANQDALQRLLKGLSQASDID
ncbi:hypothetical protein BGZ72_001156 [Mortierella alpina]|nr:hypothetical protein BGZ72_001156 [Mortierella alpina]